ncbi:cell division site-positioning protein MapZ family protein [Streptococcus suis]|uniref:cell division site-positioning protein MapZ family protein n=1 Tax=Streptococcus suis TaxID=1307 RepID=UPI001EE74883|nr:cell division site-positioning protein MapZ family protein [Streptococcus suis]
MEENKNKLPLENEKVLDFEVAKDLTIAEAVKKHKEIEAGVTEDDSLLDRYIKQHRTEIESQKFETKVNHLPLVEASDDEKEDTIQAASLSTALSDELLAVGKAVTEQVEVPTAPLEETIVAGAAVADSIATVSQEQEVDDDWGQAEEAEKERKKKIYFWSALAALFVTILATAFMWLNSVNKSTTETASSSSSSQTSTTASSSADANSLAFEQLYTSFFTDSSLTKLKNSEFGKLAELKTLLDKMDKNSDSYKKAKEQYDNLEKAIAAIQAINGQFDKEVIVNGEIDTTATVKAEASLSATNTGISSVDSLLASVVNFGRSQQEVAASSTEAVAAPAENSQADSTTAETTAPASTESAVVSDGLAGSISGAATIYGIPVPEGVVLQRDRSRVPYNQAMIDDVNNEAWTFNPGILENIVAISQQRGYITGNQYILEKVNIINGNGYYNMFTPDGSYLFSINCKTGYFVGNGSGHSDALDY